MLDNDSQVYSLGLFHVLEYLLCHLNIIMCQFFCGELKIVK